MLLIPVLTSTLVLGINYFVIITRPLHPIQVRKGSSSSCYMIETFYVGCGVRGWCGCGMVVSHISENLYNLAWSSGGWWLG